MCALAFSAGFMVSPLGIQWPFSDLLKDKNFQCEQEVVEILVPLHFLLGLLTRETEQ
jgi:hypothetical protein